MICGPCYKALMAISKKCTVLVKCGLLTDTPEIGDSTGLSGALSFYKVFFGGGGGGYTYIKKNELRSSKLLDFLLPFRYDHF